MRWDAYASSTTLSAGVDVEVIYFPIDEQLIFPQIGDEILIDLADGNKQVATITSASGKNLQVSTNNQTINWTYINTTSKSSENRVTHNYRII